MPKVQAVEGADADHTAVRAPGPAFDVAKQPANGISGGARPRGRAVKPSPARPDFCRLIGGSTVFLKYSRGRPVSMLAQIARAEAQGQQRREIHRTAAANQQPEIAD